MCLMLHEGRAGQGIMTGGGVMKCSFAVLIEACNMLLSEGICNAVKLGVMSEVLIRAKKPL